MKLSALLRLTLAAVAASGLPALAQTKYVVTTDNPVIVKGIKFQGAYASGTTYTLNDEVIEGANSYISLLASNLGNDPASSPSAWSPIGIGSSNLSEGTALAPITNLSYANPVQAGTVYDASAGNTSAGCGGNTGVGLSYPISIGQDCLIEGNTTGTPAVVPRYSLLWTNPGFKGYAGGTSANIHVPRGSTPQQIFHNTTLEDFSGWNLISCSRTSNVLTLNLDTSGGANNTLQAGNGIYVSGNSACASGHNAVYIVASSSGSVVTVAQTGANYSSVTGGTVATNHQVWTMEHNINNSSYDPGSIDETLGQNTYPIWGTTTTQQGIYPLTSAFFANGSMYTGYFAPDAKDAGFVAGNPTGTTPLSMQVGYRLSPTQLASNSANYCSLPVQFLDSVWNGSGQTKHSYKIQLCPTTGTNASDYLQFVDPSGNVYLQFHGAQIFAGSGTASQPSYSAPGNPTTGFYVSAGGTANMAVNGTDQIQATSYGVILPSVATAPSTSPVCPNGTNGALTTAGCSGSSSSQPVPLMGSPTTTSATLAFAQSNPASAPINVAVHGDSFNVANHQSGGASSGPLLAANLWTERYRTAMQTLYGSHGTGLYPIIYAAGSGGLEPLSWSCTGTWDNNTTALGPTQSSIGTLVHLAAGASCTFTDHRLIPYQNISVYYATAGTTNALTITADGSTAMGTATSANATASGVTNGGYTARRYDSATTLTMGTHTITVSSGSTDAYIYGIEGVAQTGGFALDNMGVGGARSEMFGGSTSNELAFDALINGGLSGEIAMDMTNDIGVNSSTVYQSNMQAWVTAAKALPGTPSVMIAIPPVDIVSTGSTAVAPYLAAQRSICSSGGLQCPDNAALRGDTYVSTDFDQTGTTWPGGSGGVHPTDATHRTMAQLALAKTLNPQPATSAGGCSTNCTITGTGSTAALALSSATGSPLTMTSSNAAGTTLTLGGTASGVHTWGYQADAFGHSLFGDFTNGQYAFELNRTASGSGSFAALSSDIPFGWMSGAISNNSNTPDTAFSRTAAGAVALGNGTAGDTTGSLTLNTLTATTIKGGPTFTGAGTGGTVVALAGTASGVDTWGWQSDNFAHMLFGDFTKGLYGFELQVNGTGGSTGSFFALNADTPMGWMASAVTNSATRPDTAWSRIAAGAIAPGNGTSGDSSGVYTGPATAPSGSCTVKGWQFSQDGHATFCNGSTWVSKI